MTADNRLAAHNPTQTETVLRCFTENGCEVVTIVADLVDAQQTLYGTITRDGVFVGSYYCADRVRQAGWRIVTAIGLPLTLDGHPVNLVSEDAAVLVLTTISTCRDSFEAEQWLRQQLQSLYLSADKRAPKEH